MNDDQPADAEQRQARVIAKATFLKAAKDTGDIATIRAAALTIHHAEKTDQKETPR